MDGRKATEAFVSGKSSNRGCARIFDWLKIGVVVMTSIAFVSHAYGQKIPEKQRTLISEAEDEETLIEKIRREQDDQQQRWFANKTKAKCLLKYMDRARTEGSLALLTAICRMHPDALEWDVD